MREAHAAEVQQERRPAAGAHRHPGSWAHSHAHTCTRRCSHAPVLTHTCPLYLLIRVLVLTQTLAHTCTYTHTCSLYLLIHVLVHTHSLTLVLTHTSALCTCSYVCLCTRMCTHTYAFTSAHAHATLCTHTHAYSAGAGPRSSLLTPWVPLPDGDHVPTVTLDVPAAVGARRVVEGPGWAVDDAAPFRVLLQLPTTGSCWEKRLRSAGLPSGWEVRCGCTRAPPGLNTGLPQGEIEARQGWPRPGQGQTQDFMEVHMGGQGPTRAQGSLGPQPHPVHWSMGPIAHCRQGW